MQTKVGILGLGNMGGAIYRRIPEEFLILAYDPFLKNSEFPLEKNLNSIIDECETIILCVKPDTIPSCLREIKSPKKILSIAAGVKISFMRENSHPDSKILRIMPNLPLVYGEGVLATFGDKEAEETATEIFRNCGRMIPLKKEVEMDSITALSGSGPAFAFTFIQAMAEAGVLSGLGYSTALEIAIQTLKGSSILLEKELKSNPSTHPYAWRNKVASPGGTTIAGLKKLEDGKFNATIMDAVYSAFQRSVELGEEKK